VDYGVKIMPISIGDTVPTVKDKNGDEIAIAPNSGVAVGDTVITLKDKNGDDIVIKNGPIAVGDTVICGKDQNGDDIVIKPGGCVPIDLKFAGRYYNINSISFKLSKPLLLTNSISYPEINLKIDLTYIRGGEPRIPLMYPDGAIWLMLGNHWTYGNPFTPQSEDPLPIPDWMLDMFPDDVIDNPWNTNSNWLSRLWPQAYATLGFGYDMDVRTQTTSGGGPCGGQMGKLIDLGEEEVENPSTGEMVPGRKIRWCIPNLLYYFGLMMGYRRSGPRVIEYLHIHIRNTISTFFGDGDPFLMVNNVKMCKGKVCSDTCTAPGTGYGYCNRDDDENTNCDWCYK
jgi:hypothetical protein